MTEVEQDNAQIQSCEEIETCMNLKTGCVVDFKSMSETLFTWSKKWIAERS